MNMKTKNLQFELTIEETNLILEALGQQPFVRVFGLIGKLQESARVQVEADEQSSRKDDAAITSNGSRARAEASIA